MPADAIELRRDVPGIYPGRFARAFTLPKPGRTGTPSVRRHLPTAHEPPLRPEPSEVYRVSTEIANPRQRVAVDGKFFRLGAQKFYPKGVTYGPFAPNAAGEFFASREQTAADFAMVKEAGANLLRIYYVPPRWFLDLAHEHGLKLLVDIPWNKHLCFLDSERMRQTGIDAVRAAAKACAEHPAVFALSLANEIPADVVRWSGHIAVCEFIDELVAVAKSEDAECLCTFGNFPPTEFIRPRNVDFFCWNVYLHQPRPFENYLARLQMLADTKPVMLGEFGIDSLREGEDKQAEILAWMIEATFRGGLAGAIVYSFTDDWFKDGRQITDWQFGIVSRSRIPKAAYTAVQRQFKAAPYFPLPQTPRVSVVVASYNGANTLKLCLQSLEQLNYPNYEVILVDDGSKDNTPQIAAQFPGVRTIRHPKNQGLSVARNTGIHAATGDIVAFTDSDCRADEDWLHYLVGDLLNSRYAGIGGHNFLPPDDSPVAAAVMVSPGGPAHVMLTDRLAEHIPGCNMAFYKWALLEIGGFDPLYWKAGDDVDLCWRLQQHGYRIGFSSAGFVWHYRRNTIRAFLKQQAGYGEAETMLERRHPENFNQFGGSRWSGRIYTPAKIGVETRAPIIYHGLFGSGFFQSIYAPTPGLLLVMVTSLEYYAVVSLPLLVLGTVVKPLEPIGLASVLFSLVLCGIAGAQADFAKNKLRWWSRPLVALLFLLQPIVRGWARHRTNLRDQQTPLSARENLDSLSLETDDVSLDQVLYWSDGGSTDRLQFLSRILEKLDERGWQNKPDTGWSDYDVEVYGSRWARIQLATATEYHEGGGQLIRCRLRTSWTFLSRVVFWSIAGVEVLIIAAISHWWAWLNLVTLLLLVYLLNASKRDLQRIFTTFLDGRAKELGMTRLDPAKMK
jgi:GT2 family glycosyltransferase